MPNLKPWHKVATPREDLREGKPLDASEFAVHLDQVRDGRANPDYQDPERFFSRTFMTSSLIELGGEVVRRLSGERTEANAIFNLATQFGGGKTHALTLLYHLATQGQKAAGWPGVSQILDRARLKSVPEAAIATFVGTEFDSIKGRGGTDGTPLRKTPWGEIAFQLGGETAFEEVAQHDAEFIEPKGDVIRDMLPKDRPCLILMDEIINYVSTYRVKGYHNKFYNFLQALSETARGEENVVLLVSIPASELDYTSEDESDEKRFRKMLDRLGKAIIMSAETETSEIIRRRLFEWDPTAVSASGKVLLSKDAVEACKAHADWVVSNRTQVPQWFSVDHAKETFEAAYPFHPALLSVFERKWQNLPKFQQTRGVLRMLALWVSHGYQRSFKGAHKDSLIEIGTAPLDDPQFRSAVFEQLGETKLEGPVTTDICGKKESHAVRLDVEAVDTIKAARLHRKVASTIFFESNGGQMKAEATVPEIRLGVAGPDIDIGNVETVLDGLVDACYHLSPEGNRYRFTTKDNLNKRFADRRANVKAVDIDSRVREQIQGVFPSGEDVERIFFPDKSGQIPDRPAISMIIMAPDRSLQDDSTVRADIELMNREHGKSARTYKSALLWVVPDASGPMREEARKLIAWEDIADEGLNLDEGQRRQLDSSTKKARRDLKESVWRSHKNVLLLGKDNSIKDVDLGLVTSSQSESLTKLILSRLRQSGDVEKEVSPRFLVRNWPPAFKEWSTQSVRDAFFASPAFPRLLDPDAIKHTIARGVAEGHLAYVGKTAKGPYEPFCYKETLDAADIEISEDLFVVTAEEAEKHIEPPQLTRILVSPSQAQIKPGVNQSFVAEGLDQFGGDYNVDSVTWSATGGEISSDGVYKAGDEEGNYLVSAHKSEVSGKAEINVAKEEKAPPPTPPPPGTLRWSGEIPAQKWTNFYMKVLTKLVSDSELKLHLQIEAKPNAGLSDRLVEDTKAALRGLGLDDDVASE